MRSRPRLCLAYAKTLFMVSSYTTLERWLHDAETALRGTSPALTNETAETGAVSLSERHERDNLLGEIAAQRAFITGYSLGAGNFTLAFCLVAIAYMSLLMLLSRS